MGPFWVQSPKIIFVLLSAKISFCTLESFFQKLHYFNQQKLHELYHTTGTVFDDFLTVVYQIMGSFWVQSSKFIFVLLSAKISFCTLESAFQKLHYFNQQKLHDMQNYHFYIVATYLDLPTHHRPPTTTVTNPLRQLLYYAPPNTTPWPSKMPPPATTATVGLQRRVGNDSPYHAREAPVIVEPCL
jgi:hypothetical protein